MDIFSLKCFAAVAEHLSFTTAANALYIEPSTLSKTISKLEHELKVSLFTRTSRKVKLTPAGALVLADATNIVEISDRCILKAAAASKGLVGNLNICYCGDVEMNLLPNVTRSFIRANQNISIQMSRYSWRQISNFASLQQMDLGITLSFGVTDLSSFNYCVICADPFEAVLPYDHPLASKKSIDIEELKDDTFIFSNQGMSRGAFNRSMDLLFPKGFSPLYFSEEGSDIVNLKIASGLGVSIYTRLARTYHPLLKYVPLSNVPPAQLIAIWQADNINPLVDKFIEVLKKNISVPI